MTSVRPSSERLSLDMRDFIDNLSKSYQVIAVTTRGHGKSETGNATITYEQAVDDAMAVIKEATQEPVILLGFSAGGYFAYGVAAKYPENVDKLIVIGAGEILPITRSFTFSQESALRLDKGFWEQQRALNPEPKKLDRYLAEFNRMFNTLTISKEQFGAIKCPVLVMAGEKDELPLKMNAYYMIPKSQLAIIPNAGHMVFMDNFPAVWASIVPFLVN